ncbi:MAG: HAD family hydrolase [Salinivirgaceae bacterium]|jgi:D-glycero-D-manno-heptose 1,7-bisphosphate phosphatase|nr:HAD family hydrolase [Salinivirgaceae bacterium]
MNKAVFFDRDGVINNNSHHYYIFKEEQLEIIPEVCEAIARLRAAGFLIIVISNQGGVARGLYDVCQVNHLHRVIQQRMKAHGASIDDFYFCPHHNKIGKCLCRKPQPLLLQKALAAHRIDASKSFMIGDSVRDVESAERAGIKAFKIESNTSVISVVDKILHLA